MKIEEAQNLIKRVYVERDSARGAHATFVWFVEEVGELADALRKGEKSSLKEEFADVFAWLLSLANVLDVNLQEAFIQKYGEGCPRCGRIPCGCP
jgi:NTP pyrophosphatase (non-canonical NTP hydrolase)